MRRQILDTEIVLPKNSFDTIQNLIEKGLCKDGWVAFSTRSGILQMTTLVPVPASRHACPAFSPLREFMREKDIIQPSAIDI
jgi:hypothetical protein